LRIPIEKGRLILDLVEVVQAVVSKKRRRSLKRRAVFCEGDLDAQKTECCCYYCCLI